MNRKQEILLVSVASIIGVMLLFPPFHITLPRGITANLGYNFLFNPPKEYGYFGSVDVGLLITQWVGIIIIASIAFLLLKESHMKLSWERCEGNVWCPLKRLDLDRLGNVAGVYIIWHGGQKPRCVRIGQGVIKERLSAHRNDPEIINHLSDGELFATWASVPAHQRDGVEAYLAQACNPLVGERFPDVMPNIPVNIPMICGCGPQTPVEKLSQYRT